MMNRIIHVSAISALLLALSACSTLGLSNKDEDKKLVDAKGKREAVSTNAQQVKANAGVGADWIKLPETVKNTAWPQAGDNAQNAPEHAALAAKLTRVWRSSIGDGTGRGLRLLARPVIDDGVAYAMDASGHVAAFDLQTGDKRWRVSTQAEESESAEAIGGGIAFDQGKIFATTGHGEVVALTAKDGQVLWRRKLTNPLRAAPTVADGRVFVVTVNNTTSALNEADGAVLWTHNGMPQTAALMGSANPAVAGDTVAVAYSSGEIFALRAQNGRVAWGDVLVSPLSMGAMPEMADIRGAPVIDHGGVFAMGHSGRMAALVVRSGDRAWELDIGGSNSPAIAGNTIYLLSNSQKLLAVRKDNGKIIWTQDLPHLTDPEDRTSTPMTWTGPVLAGGRLFLVNSAEQLAEYSALDGKVLTTHDLPSASFIAPVVAQATLLTVTESGDLVAYR
jgi:outer membrane protein assembly factor BamB